MKLDQILMLNTFFVMIRSQEVDIPLGLKICYRNLPNQERNECLKQSMNTIIPVIKNGFPSLDIPSIDPFHHDRSHFAYKQGILSIEQTLKNVIVNGISNTDIKTVRSKVNDKNIYIEFDALFPRIETLADYKGNAILSELTVKSGGKMNITAVDVTTTYKLLGKVNKTSGDDFISIKGHDLTNITTKKMTIDATGLFPDPDVNKFAIEFVNQHWELLYEAVLPEVKKIWGPVCVRVANGFFEHIPYNKLMPKK